MRPILLAAGLALVWFVSVQGCGLDEDGPVWGVLILVAARLAADFVGGCVAVWLCLLGIRVARIGLGRLRYRIYMGGR